MKIPAVVIAASIGLIRMMCPSVAVSADDKKIDFVTDIQPIFKESCVKCHSLDPKKPKKHGAGGFQLDDKTAAFKGGKAGSDILPGNSKDSLLVKLLSGPVTLPDSEEDKELDPMPKAKKGEKWKPLTADQIAIIRQWIDQGANWPD